MSISLEIAEELDVMLSSSPTRRLIASTRSGSRTGRGRSSSAGSATTSTGGLRLYPRGASRQGSSETVDPGSEDDQVSTVDPLQAALGGDDADPTSGGDAGNSDAGNPDHPVLARFGGDVRRRSTPTRNSTASFGQEGHRLGQTNAQLQDNSQNSKQHASARRARLWAAANAEHGDRPAPAVVR